jgi:hypothetical protein
MLCRCQEIVVATVDETAFKPRKDLAFEEQLGSKWKHVLQFQNSTNDSIKLVR